MTDVEIRIAERADHVRVLSFWRASTVQSTTDDEEALDVLLGRDGDALLLAESDGELIGTIVVGWDGWRGGLYRLAVAPRWRRRGVASRLVDAAEGRLRALGARRVGAVVYFDQDGAVSFWVARGYHADPRAGRFARML